MRLNECVSLVPSAIFCKLKNEGSCGATHLRQILFQSGKNFHGDFSDVATGLWRGLFEPYGMSRVVPAFQDGQNVHRRRPQIWTAFHVNGRIWYCYLKNMYSSYKCRSPPSLKLYYHKYCKRQKLERYSRKNRILKSVGGRLFIDFVV